MALSMFSSVAFGKTSADFTDLKDLDAATKAKFDALISAGIFDGVSETTFGLKDEMNRAQFAKVAALITDVAVNKDLKTSSFSDVKADDAANGYALPFIEALKTAGITDGYAEGQYNPAGKVTKEQLATFLVRVLGKDAEAKAKTGTDTTVSGWAQGYVALALELKLLPAGADGKFGGQGNATRELLLTGAYEAKAQYVSPGKVSVSEAKAAGAKTVTVTFNKPVDTAKATLALKKGTVAVATTTKFSDDKKSATLTLTDTVLRAGEYTTTLSGLDAAAVDKTTATFTAEDEKVTKIEFVNASDTVAKTAAANKFVNLKIKASNQYGENASASAGSYNVIATGKAALTNKIVKDADGFLILSIDTHLEDIGVGMVSVTLISTDSHITTTKNFKVGTAPLLSKIDLGAPKYSVGTGISGSGQNVKFALNMFDQYGNLIGYDQLGAGVNDIPVPQLIWNDYIDPANVNVVTEDDGNNLPVLKISLVNNVDKTADYNFTIISQAGSITGKVSLQSTKIANKIEIGDLNDVIAAHDQDVYIPVTAYDAAGNVLSVEDLVSPVNVARINVSVAGATNANIVAGQGRIEVSGENKGKIHLTNISDNKNGAVSVNVFIATANASSNASKTYTIQAARVPSLLKEATAPAKTGVVTSTSSFKYEVIDQYGKKIDSSWDVDSNGNYNIAGSHYRVVVTAVSKDANGKVYGVALPGGAGGVDTVKGTADASRVVVTADDANGIPLFNATATLFGNTDDGGAPTESAFSNFNKTFRFNAGTGSIGTSAQILVSLQKDGVEINKIDRTFTATANVNSSNLTYSVNDVATLWNAVESDLARDQINVDGKGTNVTEAAQEDAVLSKFSREVVVSAKNAAGEAVAIPKSIISVTSSNPNVARVGYDAAGKKAFVLGNKAGTATVGVTFTAADGSVKTLTKDVTVKNDALTTTAVTFDDKSLNRAVGSNVFTNVNVTDSYGKVYEDATAQQYNYLLGVSFAITNVVGGPVSINQYGDITGPVGAMFDLVANSASGKSATQAVTMTAAAAVSATPTIFTGAQTVNTATITVTGSATPSSVVTITGGAANATATTAANGVFTATVTLKAGANTLTATATETGKSASAVSNSVVITTPNGVSATPVIVTAAQTVTTPNVVVTGSAAAGSAVTITGGTADVTVTTAANGVFSATVALNEGANSLTATATEVGKTVSAATAPVVITKDTTAPAIAVIGNLTIAATSVTGVAGAVESNATVKIVAAGAGSAAAAVGITTAAANGSFAAITGLTTATSYDVYVIDAAGNVSALLNITTL